MRPVEHLEAVIFIGGIVLWGFVLAWHKKYTGRPVFTLEISARDLALAGFQAMDSNFSIKKRYWRRLIAQANPSKV